MLTTTPCPTFRFGVILPPYCPIVSNSGPRSPTRYVSPGRTSPPACLSGGFVESILPTCAAPKIAMAAAAGPPNTPSCAYAFIAASYVDIQVLAIAAACQNRNSSIPSSLTELAIEAIVEIVAFAVAACICCFAVSIFSNSSISRWKSMIFCSFISFCFCALSSIISIPCPNI